MKLPWIAGPVLCAALLAGASGGADTIYLKNGSQLEGIITRETDDSVYIEMPAGNMSITKNFIESIHRSPADEAQKIQEKWEQDRKKQEREEEARARFEDRQKAKGLVKYKGAWITPDKLAEIQRQEKKATADETAASEVAAMQKELESLKSENADLKQEINRLRIQLDQHAQEQIKLSREMLQQQKENLQFQQEAEKRQLGQRPPHIWTAPSLNNFTPYPTPSD